MLRACTAYKQLWAGKYFWIGVRGVGAVVCLCMCLMYACFVQHTTSSAVVRLRWYVQCASSDRDYKGQPSRLVDSCPFMFSIGLVALFGMPTPSVFAWGIFSE